jgi:hypothetical protein
MRQFALRSTSSGSGAFLTIPNCKFFMNRLYEFLAVVATASGALKRRSVAVAEPPSAIVSTAAAAIERLGSVL